MEIHDQYNDFAVTAQRGSFGERVRTYSTQLTLRQIKRLLGHDPRPKKWKDIDDPPRGLYESIQRKADKKRLEGLGAYIAARTGPGASLPGVFPAITICTTQPVAEIEIVEGLGLNNVFAKRMLQGIVEVRLVEDSAMVLDGLGRLSALFEAENLQHVTVPTTIVAPAYRNTTFGKEELGQLFYDLNFKAVKISEAKAVALDQSDPHIQLARLIAKGRTIAGRMDHSNSLSKKSSAVVVEKVLMKFAIGATEGNKAIEKGANLAREGGNLTASNIHLYVPRIESFLAGFAAGLEVTGQVFDDQQSLHLSALTWRALGVLFFECDLASGGKDEELHRMGHAAGQIDYSRANPDWIGVMGAVAVDKKTGVPVLDDQGRRLVAPRVSLQNQRKLIAYLTTRVLGKKAA